MKYVIIIPDGCSDWKIASLGNRTPLQAASLPNIQALARSGTIGQSCYVPDGLPPGSDVATLGLLGYDAVQHYTGRAPLEAAAQGIDLSESDWAIRCNLVTVNSVTVNSGDAGGDMMQSFSAGHIESGEAAELMQTLNTELAGKLPTATQCALQSCALQFYPSVGYRNLAILRNCQELPFDQSTKTCAPHDYADKLIAEALPTGKGNDLLRFLMEESKGIFSNHPVNQKRIQSGKLPATQIWLWGLGQKPSLPLFRNKVAPVRGAMITAVDLLKGIATLIGWDIINVPGITGYTDTDFSAKGVYAAEALKQYDIVCVHIEAPDESGHEGNVAQKIWSMEQIDSKVIPPILEALRSYGDWRLFLSPDHPTPCELKTHTSESVPWLLSGSGQSAMSLEFNEDTAKTSPHHFETGWKTIDMLFAQK